MGCGGSRLDPEREAVASKFPPRIRLRFEEIKRRRYAAAMKGTLSKKKLLKEGDHSVSQDSTDDKSLSSHDQESVKAARIAPEPESIKEEEDDNNNNNNNAIEEEVDLKKEDENEEDGEEGRIGDIETHPLVCPGSPSFKVYCAEALEPINDDSKDDIDTEEKSQRGDSCENAIVTSVNANQVSEKVIQKEEKGKKGKLIRKRNSNAVKNLLKVKSCYYPACGGQHSARFLAQKTAA